MKEKKNINVLLLLLAVLIVYVIFPSHNSSNDAYSSAVELKYHWDIFEPHHLFHNALLYVLSYPIHFLFPQIDHLALAKIWSALFSSLSLGVFYLILNLLNTDKKNTLLYIALVAFSFGVWRFSTESEFYIVPIFFSLIGSFFFLKYLINNKTSFIFIAGFFTAFACVLHQVHVFWWLGILIGFVFYSKKLKVFLYFSITAFIVPLSYILVVYHLERYVSIANVFQFTFYAYETGIAPIEFNLKNFLFFGVAIFRTFLQLFPTMLILLKKSPIFYIPLLSLLVYLGCMTKLFLNKKLVIKEQGPIRFLLFGRIHLLILILHLAFALFSMGNSEFMIMTPYLLALLLFLFYKIPKNNLIATLLLLLIWNFLYGVYPLYAYQMTDAHQMVKFIRKNQDAVFLVRNYDTKNIYEYKYGVEDYKKIIPDDQITNKTVDSLLQAHIQVYTNSINAPEVINRRSFSDLVPEDNLFDGYQKTKIDSTLTFYGFYYLYQLGLKE